STVNRRVAGSSPAGGAFQELMATARSRGHLRRCLGFLLVGKFPAISKLLVNQVVRSVVAQKIAREINLHRLHEKGSRTTVEYGHSYLIKDTFLEGSSRFSLALARRTRIEK